MKIDIQTPSDAVKYTSLKGGDVVLYRGRDMKLVNDDPWILHGNSNGESISGIMRLKDGYYIGLGDADLLLHFPNATLVLK